MYLISKSYTTPDAKLSAIIKNNPLLLLVLENFGITVFNKDITVAELCREIKINENFFLSVCNLHNGFYVDNIDSISKTDLIGIIAYLKRSHAYYISEKYPEILNYIQEIRKKDDANIHSVIETYFNEYFEEVKEHMYYEERTAFPYFLSLLSNEKGYNNHYSSQDYQDHHSDIETRLNSLKDFIVQHVHLKDKNNIKRKLLISLSELEFELRIHSFIEDMILIPLIKRVENEGR